MSDTEVIVAAILFLVNVLVFGMLFRALSIIVDVLYDIRDRLAALSGEGVRDGEVKRSVAGERTERG